MTASKKRAPRTPKPPPTPEERASGARRAAVVRGNASVRRLVADEAEQKLYADSVARYADACAQAERLRAEWEELGRPQLAEGSMRQPIPHPMVKMVEAAEAQAAKFAAAIGLDLASVRRRGPGRPVGAVSAPDRVAVGEPPRIRRVK